jgi:hypothetical protein
MSWDLDEQEAVELVEEYIAAMPPPEDDVWVITGVVEHSWGWVISWVNKRAAQASQDTRDMYAGGGPFLVKRADGRVAMCGSAYPPEHYIGEWRRGDLPDLPHAPGARGVGRRTTVTCRSRARAGESRQQHRCCV